MISHFGNGTNKVLVADILRFLDGLRSFWESQDRAELLVLESLHEIRNAVAQFGASTAEAQQEHADVRFITSFGGPLVEQFRNYFEGGTLRVAAPYFGGSVSGLRSLKEILSLRKLQVFPSIHSDNTLDVSLQELAMLFNLPHANASPTSEGAALFSRDGRSGVAKPWSLVWLFVMIATKLS
jgi:hypothetical protein